MIPQWLLVLAFTAMRLAIVNSEALVVDTAHNVTYQGLTRNGVEFFLGVPYAQDTGGANRFKPPQLHVPDNDSTVDATAYGPACPQVMGLPPLYPLTLSNVTDVSEDCLHLNIARPSGISANQGCGLPVMVFIHGGSFWDNSNAEITNAPDALVLQSVENGLPVIYVAMNYRLGAFGFAQTQALRQEGSLNAGLRDQRLAIEWVRDNIGMFGGNGEAITIFGQSSGGLAVGMQIMAYGGTKPVPFQRGICESQALEPGITGNFTYHQMDLLATALGCNTSTLDSNETLACLRASDTTTFLNASIATYSGDVSHNIGDVWLPAVDDDFLPAAPSTLVSQHRMATNVSVMIGWTDDDLGFFTPRTIASDADTRDFVTSYLPDLDPENTDALLALYPVSDFAANPAANLTAQFYRSARIFRDVLMTCMPIWFGDHLAQMHSPGVYLYDQNATILTPILAAQGYPGLGPVHTSEFAYVYANFSHYDTLSGFAPTEQDYALLPRQSRSWTSFAATGQPSLVGKETLVGWGEGFVPMPMAEGKGGQGNRTEVFVIGGGTPGLWALDGDGEREGEGGSAALTAQRLGERCAFLNSGGVIAQLKF
ncbi:uncharacterized protein HMPREF1541_04328 [Cyphellophora europaea CBS 101466]|uniref:Carboxylic ester hydrolase n=1 Tax=Cyphellophora europaea (strain CBS 101466) TaxID=1220924 RepID=W2RWB4_CYPE1|nr:uncharacterized protein HMPREF1541_04328 [Cyphellophora europaea CBS 101466]ETN40053.1 hypothetical protein HMPREF1541_04328 [Cyphellophora europaea CBS 101466]